ncbi:alpha/beta fold hydrolase [Oceanicola sp. S124]|uniref:alpha/beta fold hydrolase n=1 Tax=Oceanicola sp. S124 TaxID=1042378 RepID=UPI0002558D2F|nr:alpha/beta hydrolase [Oceanicola sp. S124]
MLTLLAWLVAGCLGAIALFFAITWLACQLKQRRVMRTYPVLGRFEVVNGHRVHVHQFGSGPDLVIAHGATSHMREAIACFARGLEGEFRITLIDRPGEGHTRPLHRRGESLREQADFLADTVRALGIDSFVLLGQSFGGSVALAWALHRPEGLRAMALAATPAYPWLPHLPWRIKGPAMPVLGPLIAQVVFAWFPQSYFQKGYAQVFFPNAVPDGYGDRIGLPLSLLPRNVVADNRQLARMGRDLSEIGPHYGKIAIPVEVVNGAEDAAVKPELHAHVLGREIPGARVRLLKGQGHMPHVGDPEGINDAVRRAARRAAAREQ